jgi:hypothetical protein
MSKETKTINNVQELRDNLADVFQRLKSGEMEVKTVAELTNVAGKMIQSAKVQIEYYALRKESPTIAFLASKD